ncbi:hypothetical protein DSO57_1025352 [Entomophthora muscae]|uniref:Uncharacterized protein n=1 Tax=Entomophthora muscae TaxID=34485 RepID=A0ACC2U0A1_9FUNG|nr:hypothetical protein DSO57_1025352 [Entomophthora muscae]
MLLVQHWADWVTVGLGIAAAMALGNIPSPAVHFSYQDPALSRPFLAKETISKPAVIIYSSLVPVLLFTWLGVITCDLMAAHQAILGLALSNTLTYILVNVTKAFAGRLRPDWLARCALAANKGKEYEDAVDCRILDDGRRSFISGHAGASFSAAMYTSLFLSTTLRLFEDVQVYKSFLVLIPLLAASVVSISRITDNRHHWSDVAAGALSGSSFAIFTFLQFSNMNK